MEGVQVGAGSRCVKTEELADGAQHIAVFQQGGNQHFQALNVLPVGVVEQDAAVLHSLARFLGICLADIPQYGVGITGISDGVANAGAVGALGIAVGRAHDVHGIMITEHGVQLLLCAQKLVENLPVVALDETGMPIGVVANFAAVIEHGLPDLAILLPQGGADHKEGNRYIVLFA